ncbi:MAG TPA: hypothetical protein VHC43_10020 [Mycobacteriales bacterium]|nr:hypothetical protein [Mycobacteriales bacterium]
MRRGARLAVAVIAAGISVGPATAALGVPLAKPHVAVVRTASDAPKTLTGRITNAAWFQPDPLCSTPLGCGAIPLPALSPYPKGTFHIGTALGRQTARAYVGVSLSKREQAARGGTLSIPLDTDPADGSVAPATATINVCTVYQSPADVEGGFDGAPSPNCLPAARAKYVAKPAPHLVADLKPLGGKLAAVKAFALLPAQAKPTSAWQVVFRLPSANAPASARPRLTLLVGSQKQTQTSQVTHHHAAHRGTSAGANGPTGQLGDGAVPSVPPAVTSVEPPTPTPVIAPARRAGHWVTVGYQYPEVWLLPIVLVLLVPFTVRALTRDLTRPRPHVT